MPQPPLLSCPAAAAANGSSSSCYLTALNASLLNGTLQPGSLASCNGLTSPSGKYRLVVQDDGNLVLYNLQTSQPAAAPAVQWASNTTGVAAAAGPVVLKLWLNGTLGLVWYRRDAKSATGWRVAAVRNTAPNGGLQGGVYGGGAAGAANGPFALNVRDDGRAYVQNKAGAVVWATSDPGGPAAFSAIGEFSCVRAAVTLMCATAGMRLPGTHTNVFSTPACVSPRRCTRVHRTAATAPNAPAASALAAKPATCSASASRAPLSCASGPCGTRHPDATIARFPLSALTSLALAAPKP